MPNHVQNEIIISSLSSSEWRSFRGKVLNNEDHVDFEILLPPPLYSWPGNVNSVQKATFPTTDLDWCSGHWGTKWNAYESRAPIVEDGTITLRFQTAWSPPMGWLCALFRTINRDFEHRWLSEGEKRAKVGRFVADRAGPFGGPDWSCEEASEKIYRHMYVLLWGKTPEEMDDEDPA